MRVVWAIIYEFNELRMQLSDNFVHVSVNKHSHKVRQE